MRYWPTFTRHEGANLLAGAAHVQRITAQGIFPRIYRVPNAGLSPGALPCQGYGRSFELELAFIGLFTRDPHVCTRACVRACTRSLQISIAIMIVHHRWVRRA
jgi:hypothetical protein